MTNNGVLCGQRLSFFTEKKICPTSQTPNNIIVVTNHKPTIIGTIIKADNGKRLFEPADSMSYYADTLDELQAFMHSLESGEIFIHKNSLYLKQAKKEK